MLAPDSPHGISPSRGRKLVSGRGWRERRKQTEAYLFVGVGNVHCFETAEV